MNILFIKNINLTNTPNLANFNYTILVSKATSSTKQSMLLPQALTKNKSHSNNKV